MEGNADEVRTVDLIIIGGGPGGYEIAAAEAAKGRKVVLVEKDKLGGTCLNRGCIPTKALCASASVLLKACAAGDYGISLSNPVVDYPRVAARKDAVVVSLRADIEASLAGVELVTAEARLEAGPKVRIVGGAAYKAEKIIIATGSRPKRLPVPGAELAMDSSDIIALEVLPADIVIIGAGVIGMEFASVLSAFGVEVTVLEYCKEVLPAFDAEVAKRLRSMLSRRGVKFVLGAAVKEIKPDFSVDYETKKGLQTIGASAVLMAVGREPVLPEGLKEAGVTLNERGFIEVDDTMQTDAFGVYAVGDVNGICMLAHAASAQARVAVGEDVDMDIMPSVVFSEPECAMVGLTEEMCKAQGADFLTVKVPYASNGKALASGEAEGFVKLVFSPVTHLLLGCHAVGAHSADLVAEAAAAMYGMIPVDELADELIHAHPTLSELLASAARKAAAMCRE